MKEYDGPKNWASQYHPSGSVNQGGDGPVEKWVTTIVKATVMFGLFLFVIGALWQMFWETYVFDVVFYACVFSAVVSAILMRRHRIAKVVFGYSCITALGTVFVWFVFVTATPFLFFTTSGVGS